MSRGKGLRRRQRGMTKRVLIFFPHNLSTPRTGAHKRGLEILHGLNEIGCEVGLASSTLSTDTPWQSASVESLKDRCSHVYVYEATQADLAYRARLQHYYQPNYLWLPIVRRLHPLGHREPPFNTRIHTPPSMRRWFDEVVEQFAPDIIVMNYAYWDRLIDHARLKSVVRIIDTIDLISLNKEMQNAIRKWLPDPLSIKGVSDELLREDFFETQDISASPGEFRIYDQYNYCIAIAATEAEMIRRNTRRTHVTLLPMTQEPRFIVNHYDGPALFPVGPNLFNTQGYLSFVNRVLPQVLRSAPEFVLKVTGFYENIIPRETVEGVEFAGFLPSLQEAYEHARFAICPVFGGTGQQVKIVEAMAYGVPVVAFRPAAERSPLQHQVNGLVANNSEEFATHVATLWNDRDMCRKLGRAARETIANGFSRETLLKSLAGMIEPSVQS
jgi:glycosyltransferase involved in cell wall biosynthesis